MLSTVRVVRLDISGGWVSFEYSLECEGCVELMRVLGEHSDIFIQLTPPPLGGLPANGSQLINGTEVFTA